jgi:phospho-N-acetylmuramoyl-pentapeptide-transferase
MRFAWRRQVVRTDGPMSHAKKKGTPTMGGLSFLPVAVTVACLLTDFAPAVVATSAATVAYALLGCADDVAKMLRKNSRGVSLRAKLAVQVQHTEQSPPFASSHVQLFQ